LVSEDGKASTVASKPDTTCCGEAMERRWGVTHVSGLVRTGWCSEAAAKKNKQKKTETKINAEMTSPCLFHT